MQTKTKLEKLAIQLRIAVLQQINVTQSGHLAGPFSCADIITFLYFYHLKHNPENPVWPERDYFLVSNGHVAPIWYAALAYSGYFPKEELLTIRKHGSRLQGHPVYGTAPGVENSSGPLGHGAGQAVGIALALKLDKKPNHVYCLMSDGEQQEGASWEAALVAAKYNLSNLTFILDLNQIQIDGYTKDIMPLPNMAKIYTNIGFEVLETDGHNFDELKKTFTTTRSTTKPRIVIAHTIPGKGVSFMENDFRWHDWRGNESDVQKGIDELQNKLKTYENNL